MLITIKNKIRGWVAWVVVVIIVIPFALFGIGEYLSTPNDKVIAKVNDKQIMQSEFNKVYNDNKRALQENLGDNYTEETDRILQNSTIASIIKSHMLDSYSKNLNLSVADKELKNHIVSLTEFHDENNNFSLDKYKKIIRLSRYTEESFKEYQKQEILKNQIFYDIKLANIINPKIQNLESKLLNQERKFSYLELDHSKFLKNVSVDNKEITDIYNNNKKNFIKPKTVKVEYLELSINDIKEGIEVDDEALLELYKQEQYNYTIEEKRQASHILIIDKDKANKVLTMVKSGFDFAKLAQKYSEDTGSSEQGGDLGEFGSGVMVPSFEKAVFGLNVGDISELVQSEFGYHIIKLVKIIPENIPEFDDIKQDIKQDYIDKLAEEKLYELTESLANTSYESESLTDVAVEFNSKLNTTDFFSINDINKTNILTAKFVNNAFSDIVYEKEEISPVIEEKDKILVMKMLVKQESRQLELTEVAQDIKDEQLDLKAKKFGIDVLKNIKDKLDSKKQQEVKKLLSKYKLAWTDINWITRQQESELITLVFNLNSKQNSNIFVLEVNNQALLVKLDGVRISPEKNPQINKQISDIHNSMLEDGIINSIVAAQKYEIVR